MATGNIDQAQGVLKIVTGRYTKNYELAALAYNRANKGAGQPLSDRGFEIPTEIEGNFAHGWMTDGGDYPAGGSVKTIRQAIYFKEFISSLRLTMRAIETVTSAGGKAAISSWLERNVDSTIEDSYKLMNFYCMGTGNGVLATVSAAANSTTQTFDNNNNVRYLRNGMRLRFWNSARTVLRGSATITSFPTAGDTTVTLDSAVNVAAATDVATIFGGNNQAITGLKAIIDDTSEANVIFQNQSRNTYNNLRAQAIDASNASLDLELLTRMIGANIQIRMGAISRSEYELWSYPSQTAAFQALGWNLKRITEGSKSVKLGYTSYEFQGMPWVEETDLDKDRVYFIDWSKIQKYVAKDWGWKKPDGNILRLVPSSTSGIAYTSQAEGYWGVDCNLGSPDTRGLGKLYSLSVPTGY